MKKCTVPKSSKDIRKIGDTKSVKLIKGIKSKFYDEL